MKGKLLLLAVLILAPLLTDSLAANQAGWLAWSGYNDSFKYWASTCAEAADLVCDNALKGEPIDYHGQCAWYYNASRYKVNCAYPDGSRRWSNLGKAFTVSQACGSKVYSSTTNDCITKPAENANIGTNQCVLMSKNPIHIGIGNKYWQEHDYIGTGPFPLAFTRYYNSHDSSLPNAQMGNKWRHSYERTLYIVSSNEIIVQRPDGRRFTWIDTGDGFENTADTGFKLWRYTDGLKYETNVGDIETYRNDGRLLSIEDPAGRKISFTYEYGKLKAASDDTGRVLSFTFNSERRLNTLTMPGGGVIRYGYDESTGNLTSVFYPDTTPEDDTDNPTRIYHYENSIFPNALTGITDERGIRYSTYEYDDAGRAVASYLGPVNEDTTKRIDGVVVDYLAGGVRTVTDSRGAVSTYTTVNHNGVELAAEIMGPGCASCGVSNTSFSYDPVTNHLLSKTENGVTTEYGDYDSYGNYGYRIEAAGTTEERRTYYTYDPRFQGKVDTITETSVSPGKFKVTNLDYDDFSELTSIKISGYLPDGTAVSRTTNYQYGGDGTTECDVVPLRQLCKVDGPRTDVADITHYRYYPNDESEGFNRGRLKEIENAKGVLVRSNIQYTASGKVASEARPNGMLLTYTYYPGRNRLKTLTESADSTSRTTRWTYLGTGEVESFTTGYGSAQSTTLLFGYDDARRLERITDDLGHYVKYTLDTKGNQIGEEIWDNGNPASLRKKISRTFDFYHRLDVTSQENEIIDYDYSPDGTLDRHKDGKDTVTDYDYDALKRLTKITQDLGGTNVHTANTQSIFEYDAQDNLISVTDPVELETTYRFDDLGNLLEQVSPDTGGTSYTHDEKGNILSKKDARSITTDYSYDALDRLTSITYPDETLNVVLNYDEDPHGIGHLSRVKDGSGMTSYRYSPVGNLATDSRTIGDHKYEVHYSYNNADKIIQITYPSGREINYQRDSLGRIIHVSTTHKNQINILTDAVTYFPSGSLSSLIYGNGMSYAADFDNAGRLTHQEYGSASYRQYLYDTNSNITNILSVAPVSDSAALDESVIENTQPTGDLTDVETIIQAAAEIFPRGDFSYDYDALSRLISERGPYGHRSYEYDSVGNRTNRLKVNEKSDGAGNTLTKTRDQMYHYAVHSNQLEKIDRLNNDGNTVSRFVLHDASGNIIQKNTKTFEYDDGGRLSAFKKSGVLIATYRYNGKGERVSKTKYKDNGNRVTIDYHYDQSGRLLGLTRYNTAGLKKAEKDIVWLDNRPIAQITTKYNQDETVNSEQWIYIHTDHLNTPRLATDEQQRVVWIWTSDSFGQGAPENDPDGDGIKTFLPLRFPGQMASEGGLYYNYFRDYDPSTGRYLESDPIGLEGGLNTYVYAFDNPLMHSDFYGLYWGIRQGYFGARARALRRYIASFLGLSVTVGTVAGGVAAAPTVAGGFISASESLVVGDASITTGTMLVSKITTTTHSLVCAARTSAASGTTVLITNPAAQQQVLDFIQGFLVSGPPPPTPAGTGGFTSSLVLDGTMSQ